MVQKDSTALKFLKSHFASAEHGPVSLLYIECAIFYQKKWWIIKHHLKIYPLSHKNWHVLKFLFWNFWHFPPQRFLQKFSFTLATLFMDFQKFKSECLQLVFIISKIQEVKTGLSDEFWYVLNEVSIWGLKFSLEKIAF